MQPGSKIRDVQVFWRDRHTAQCGKSRPKLDEGRRSRDLQPSSFVGWASFRGPARRGISPCRSRWCSGQRRLTSGERPVVVECCIWCHSSPGASRRSFCPGARPGAVERSQGRWSAALPKSARQDPVGIRTSPGQLPIRRQLSKHYKAFADPFQRQNAGSLTALPSCGQEQRQHASNVRPLAARRGDLHKR
jgi:hypothetical protein